MKKSILRLTAGLLALLMLAGCGAAEEPQPILPEAQPQPEAEAPAEPGVLRVAWEQSESLNPFSTGSLQNYHLAQLLYDPLYRMDEAYNTTPCIARSMEMMVDQVWQEETMYEEAICTLRLRSGLRFWDGTELAARDVVFSLQQAIDSPYFGAGLAHVSQVTADPKDPLTVYIRLTRPDAFFEKSLTFPIVQADSGTNNRPVGCGRFMPQGETTFVPNPDHNPVVETFAAVELVPVTALTALGYSIKTDLIDLACSDLTIPWNRSLGNGYTPVQLSNLVYLGINQRGILANRDFRDVVYRLLNRNAIDEAVYLGQDTATWMPFNPAVEEIGSQVVALPGQMTQRSATELLDGIGLAKRDQYGYRTWGGASLTLTLLVNSENTERVTIAEGVAYTLEQLGIRTVVERCSFEDYSLRLAEGYYDLYVGEVRMPWNMNLLPMLGGWNETVYGMAASPELQQAARDFLRTGKGYGAVSGLFAQEIPFIPLMFRQGLVAYRLNFCSNIVATEQDIFYNIEEWDLA